MKPTAKLKVVIPEENVFEKAADADESPVSPMVTETPSPKKRNSSINRKKDKMVGSLKGTIK